MDTHPKTAHGPCDGRVVLQEPDFDAERVIWDGDYRRHVMKTLREWRLRQGQDAASASSGRKAA